MSLMAFHRQYGLPVMIARFANFYGPGQQLYRIVPRAIMAAVGVDQLTLDGGGKSIRAFIYGKDIASGIFSMLMKGKHGQTYHFSTDDFVSIKELVEQIAELLNTDIHKFSKDGSERPGKDAAYLMDSQKAKTELNWEPEVRMKEGLQKTIEWVTSNLDELKTLPREYIHQP